MVSELALKGAAPGVWGSGTWVLIRDSYDSVSAEAQLRGAFEVVLRRFPIRSPVDIILAVAQAS